MAFFTLFKVDKNENYHNFKKELSKFGEIKYSEDKKTVILNVELEKDKEYQFILSGRSFKSNEKIPMREYEINFRTQ
jgi:hypothetical protein